jgi:DNA-binding NarL/FixJ family response regulator
MPTIALADDHIPTLKRFSGYFQKQTAYKVLIEAVDGHDLLLQLNTLQQLPDIILVDINMPVMDGVAVTYYLKLHYSSIKVIGVSVYSDENTLKDVMYCSANGYIMKGLAETILPKAIDTVMKDEIFIDPRIDIEPNKIKEILARRKKIEENENSFELTPPERQFVILNATPLTYDQIAATMFVETKTIQTYYDRVTKKLNVYGREALTLFSLRNGLTRMVDFNYNN